jgi:hypothetical protein
VPALWEANHSSVVPLIWDAFIDVRPLLGGHTDTYHKYNVRIERIRRLLGHTISDKIRICRSLSHRISSEQKKTKTVKKRMMEEANMNL